ncbi:MAG: DUF177 domain-containing protein [Paracoccaceae bacterium]
MAHPENMNPAPEFSRPVTRAELLRERVYGFDIAPERAEYVALARLYGARSVRKLRFRGEISEESGESLVLNGRLGATVVQSCVVTLAPVTTRLDMPVQRRFVAGAPGRDEIQFDPEETETDILGDAIDLGLVATEEIALALPDYPRAEGAALVQAEFRPPGAAPAQPKPHRPFAGLAALRNKLKD